jgi:hypothetical protein
MLAYYLRGFSIILVSILVLSALPNRLGAQEMLESSQGYNGKWKVGTGGGLNLFYGDIRKDPWGKLFVYESDFPWNSYLYLEHDLSPSFSLRAQGIYARLTGTARPNKYDFETELIELGLGATVNINNLFGPNRYDRFFTVNLLLGGAASNFRSDFYQRGTGFKIGSIGYGGGQGLGGRTLDGVLFAGLGFDFRLSDHWLLRLESSNKVIMDNALVIFENSFPMDLYNQTTLGIAYRFGASSPRIMRMAPDDPTIKQAKPVEKPITPSSETQQTTPAFDFRVFPSQTETTETDTAAEFVYDVNTDKINTLNVEYRVQILAKFGTKISVAQVAKKYKLREADIKEDAHNGFFIYTTGSFTQYEEAAQLRNTLKNEHGVFDAFVVAFKDGKRLDRLP